MKLLRALAALGALVALALWWDAQRAIGRPAGIVAPGEPQQTSAAGAPKLTHGEFELTPLARFALEARVLSRADYRFGTESELAPTDLVLGWGGMSDSAVLEHVSIAQSGRWYTWNALDAPISLAEIAASSANMHMIPGNAGVAAVLARARAGNIVTLSGYLVEARRARDQWSWTSSLSRTDTGFGACELVYVESMTLR